ncbi:MAG: hypothetical protein WCP97_00540 [bacterium]
MPALLPNTTVSIYMQTAVTGSTVKKSDSNTDSLKYSAINAHKETRVGEFDQQQNQIFTFFIDKETTPLIDDQKADKYRLVEGSDNYTVYSIIPRLLVGSWEIIAARAKQ